MKILSSLVLSGLLCLGLGLVSLVITSEASACDIPSQTSTKTPPKK